MNGGCAYEKDGRHHSFVGARLRAVARCRLRPLAEQPADYHHHLHVYGGQTDSPLNDLIDVFNNTVGVEEGIRVEVAMVSDNKNIHNGIIAAAAGEPGRRSCPICSFPIRRPFLLCLIRASLSIIAITSPKTSLQPSCQLFWKMAKSTAILCVCPLPSQQSCSSSTKPISTAFPLQQA